MTQASYTVLARRYRPQTFDDVVGQGHVGQALRNAIRTGRVAHAYLFTGARGVGKTSTARIFAKALNCPNAVDGVPCNECDICQGISTGNDVDVLEIDGASNRGIDDIRQLRANVNVKSMRSRYKVYIIDEVHMLTKEAFNALLKTLEEPPPNVKFVFCTTEPDKVPDTIRSRCQRFDFGTIATDSIADRLAQIAQTEGVAVDADAIELVARRAAGSMRDSQSLFDQLLAFGDEHITTADVHKLLGTAPDERLIELFEALIQRDRGAALQQLGAALGEGVQLGPFSDQLLEYLRDLLIVLAGAQEVPLASVGEASRSRLAEQGSRWGLATVAAAMQILAETKGRMQRANYGRALLELALVRISLLEDLDDIGRLVQRIGSGAPSSSAPGGQGDAATRGEPRSAGLRQRLQGQGGGDSRGSRPAGGSASSAAERPASATLSESPQITAAGPAGVAKPALSGQLISTEAASCSAVADAPSDSGEIATADGPDISEQAAEAAERADFTPETVDAFWAQLLQRVPDTLSAHLKNADKLAIFAPNTLEISFPPSYVFSMNYCQRREPLAELSRIAARLAGRPVEVQMRAETNGVGSSTPPGLAPNKREETRLRPKVVDGDAFIQQAVSLFGGTIVDVRRVLESSHTAVALEADERDFEVNEED